MLFLHTAETIKKNFAQELHNASVGAKTSLGFIKHILPAHSRVKENGLLQVLVIGGSIFRKALIKIENKHIIILRAESSKLPPLTSEEVLVKYVAEQIYSETDTVAINFAYPLDPFIRNNHLDGRLLSGTKENTFNGLAGKPIGKTCEDYILNTHKRQLIISVANDAICLLLSGLNKESMDYLAGGIMGTGTNMTLFYKNQAVNLESGNFDKFSPSQQCRQVDQDSIHHKDALFEKETSGAYLFEHFNLIINNENINYPLLQSTKEMAEIIKSDLPASTSNLDTQQKAKIAEISKKLFEKSAAYFAAQIAGLAEFKNHDLTFIVEGSMYWENEFYQKDVSSYLAKLSADINISLIKVENSSLYGATKLIT